MDIYYLRISIAEYPREDPCLDIHVDIHVCMDN